MNSWRENLRYQRLSKELGMSDKPETQKTALATNAEVRALVDRSLVRHAETYAELANR